MALVLLGAGSVVAGLISRWAVEDRFELAMTAGKQKLVHQIIYSHVNQMRSATANLTRNRAALAAIDAGDAELVGEEVRPAFNRLSAGKLLDRIRIVGKAGNLLFSEPAFENSQRFKTRSCRGQARRAKTGRVSLSTKTAL